MNLSQFHLPEWVGLIEILVLACVYYYLILFFHGTRGAAVLTGLVVLLVTLIFLTNVFHLNTLSWILQHFTVYLVIAFVVIFQPEIRRALAELGKQPVFSGGAPYRGVVDDLAKAANMLSERKVGALIGIEREIRTRHIQESGTRIDSQLTPELLATIFYPHTPLHDGGVIIRDNRIVSAGCIFPLSQREELSKSLGTRHRAAIGLTEETDAVVVIVSEETGAISVAYRGRLSRGMDEPRLRRILNSILLRRRKMESRFSGARKWLDLSTAAVARTNEDSEASEDEATVFKDY